MFTAFTSFANILQLGLPVLTGRFWDWRIPQIVVFNVDATYGI